MRTVTFVAVAMLAAASGASAAPQSRCTLKAGEATGITRAFAEYEALLIIRQVTGNWPIAKDSISDAVYACKQGAVLWTCAARAKVCQR